MLITGTSTIPSEFIENFSHTFHACVDDPDGASIHIAQFVMCNSEIDRHNLYRDFLNEFFVKREQKICFTDLPRRSGKSTLIHTVHTLFRDTGNKTVLVTADRNYLNANRMKPEMHIIYAGDGFDHITERIRGLRADIVLFDEIGMTDIAKDLILASGTRIIALDSNPWYKYHPKPK